ncbi:hypothetical protein GCM10011491_11130 [Brucella endophytica]|uniref:Uncharacterized protein n=2 Tax=Brucella endophytica TaxID=1963359 RepID=A0A916S7V4_9HYPH|nr:hypothetical protein GCM10011491_11130 [Brucella endophytica]
MRFKTGCRIKPKGNIPMNGEMDVKTAEVLRVLIQRRLDGPVISATAMERRIKVMIESKRQDTAKRGQIRDARP